MPIKYLGSKRRLIPSILEAVGSLCPEGTVLDLFSGTGRVGHALKRAGYRVLANDHNAYAATIARCYVQADLEDWEVEASRLLEELSRLPGQAGWFTETFCIRSRFFHPRNGERIDAIRDRIATLDLPAELEAILLVSLMEAADRVDSTTGVQMAYLKHWAPRALKDLELRMPELLPRPPAGKCEAFQLDALDAAKTLAADLAYLDPPYNQHSYLGNYHVWESLVLWDRPEVYGVACKRTDCRSRRSAFNSKRRFASSWKELLDLLRCPAAVVSFNDEGLLSTEEMWAALRNLGRVSLREFDSKRYVGAQIGIHDLQGRKVGKVGRLHNREHLFLVERAAC